MAIRRHRNQGRTPAARQASHGEPDILPDAHRRSLRNSHADAIGARPQNRHGACARTSEKDVGGRGCLRRCDRESREQDGDITRRAALGLPLAPRAVAHSLSAPDDPPGEGSDHGGEL
jgi:hypothetical protein